MDREYPRLVITVERNTLIAAPISSVITSPIVSLLETLRGSTESSYSSVFRYTSNTLTLTLREIIKHADQAARAHLESEIPFFMFISQLIERFRVLCATKWPSTTVNYLVEFDRLMNFSSFLVFQRFLQFYCSNFIQPSIQIFCFSVPINPSENRKNTTIIFSKQEMLALLQKIDWKTCMYPKDTNLNFRYNRIKLEIYTTPSTTRARSR